MLKSTESSVLKKKKYSLRFISIGRCPCNSALDMEADIFACVWSHWFGFLLSYGHSGQADDDAKKIQQSRWCTSESARVSHCLMH